MENIEQEKTEIEDEYDVLRVKLQQLVQEITKAKHLVVFTGAGISTAGTYLIPLNTVNRNI